MNCIGTYDGTIFYNPANKFCIVSVKTADQSVPAEARSNRRYKDHLIRFTAVGYEIPRTDAVELELDGEWTKGKYGVQLQVEQWHEIVPRTKNGVEGYLASGLIKGIGPKTAADIVERFGVDTLDILEHQPERLLEIRGITESKLEDIKASYAENRMLQGIMTLLAPFKITPKTALKIYQYFGPTSVEILEKSPFELCQISGFGFRRVDAIVQKSGGNLHDSMRIKGAVFCALDEGKSKRGHLYISSEELEKSALKLLNEKIPVPELRLHQQEVRDMMQEMILNGAIVSVKDNIYLPRVFAQEDETARRIAQRLVTQMPVEHIAPVLEQVKVEMGLRLSAQQEAAVYAAFRHGLSVITGSPGTGKTTVLRTILEVYRRLHPDGKIALMAPTGRASRRMSESTGFEDARTLHSGLGLTSEEDEGSRNRKSEPLSADLIIVDEFSMVDMWLAEKFFERMKINARIVLVGDPDQLPSVGAGNVFREIIETKIVPVTVLDQIFRQSKDSLIAYNAKFINEGNTKLFYGPDFVFVSGDSQEDTAEKITERYCLEIQESGIENVQILSPFRSEGAASSEQLNETIRELVNPFRSAEEEIKFGPRIFRVNDRIMQTKNTEKVSNGDLGFIRYIKDTDQGKKIGMDFGAGRTLEYGVDDLSNVDLAYATTIHKAMGSEYETVIMPLLKAHTIMMYRNLLYTGITRAKKRVVLIGQKQVLFMAIHRNEIGKRNTLLGMRIQMYFKAYAKKAGIPIPAALEEQLKNGVSNMNEKSNPMPMMYKTIPAVAELNKVPGFDPLKFLRHKVSRKTNEEMLQLELPYQKLWFRLRHPQGRMKLTTLRITEQLAIMEARVYLDRSDAEPISSYISQHSAEEGTDYVQAAQDEALSAALSDAGFGLQFADVAVDSTGKVFGSSIPLSGTAPIRQPMPNAAQRPVEAPGAALRQSGGEVHARPERAPQNAVEGRNAPARPAPIQKPAAKPVQNEQPPVSPVQPVVQQMVAEEKENMDTLPAGKVEENAPNMELPVPSREVTLDSSPKQDDASEQPAASVFQSDEPEELPVAPVVQQEAPDQPVAPSYTESTPVEDILKVMTFEEAQNVVVDSGLSKGKTMATVAKERPVSLKFYLTPGNKSTNNIVRAAAQIMLDGMAAQKAG